MSPLTRTAIPNRLLCATPTLTIPLSHPAKLFREVRPLLMLSLYAGNVLLPLHDVHVCPSWSVPCCPFLIGIRGWNKTLMEASTRVGRNDRGNRDPRQRKETETLTYLEFQELTQMYSGVTRGWTYRSRFGQRWTEVQRRLFQLSLRPARGQEG